MSLYELGKSIMPMYVYIVTKDWDYESADTLEVFTDFEKAEAFVLNEIDVRPFKKKNYSDYILYDLQGFGFSYSITIKATDKYSYPETPDDTKGVLDLGYELSLHLEGDRSIKLSINKDDSHKFEFGDKTIWFSVDITEGQAIALRDYLIQNHPLGVRK